MPQVAQILGNAFRHAPVLIWMCGEPEVYAAFSRCEAEADYEHHGRIYVDHEGTGAAMGLPPGAPLGSVIGSEPYHE